VEGDAVFLMGVLVLAQYGVQCLPLAIQNARTRPIRIYRHARSLGWKHLPVKAAISDKYAGYGRFSVESAVDETGRRRTIKDQSVSASGSIYPVEVYLRD
jgi:hypothetical protein